MEKYSPLPEPEIKRVKDFPKLDRIVMQTTDIKV
jgi:hypothetical protein